MLQILCGLALLASARGAYVNDAATVVDFGRLKLHLCAPSIVRVTFASAATPPPRVASAVVRAWPDAVPYTFENDTASATVTVVTSALAVAVNTSSLDVAFLNASTRAPLLREAGRALAPAADFSGAPATRVAQRWALAPGEALFGGGSQQQGMLDFRSAPMQLAQRNTEAGVPVFTSSKGWGLLWDATSAVWLNKPATPPLADDAFTAAASGRHHFTLVMGEYAFVGAEVKLTATALARGGRRDGGAPAPVVVFDFTNMTNVPAVVTGGIELEAGRTYALNLSGVDGGARAPRLASGEAAALYVSPPRDEFELASEVDSHVDYYFFGGATVDASVALFRAASGAAPLFAKWVYGFWQCKEHYASQDELIAAAEGFRNRSLPLDAIVQDWRYWGDDDNWGPVWDTDAGMYPDPAGLVTTLHAMGVRLMVSVWAKFSNAACIDALERSGDALVDVANNTEHYMDAWDPATRATYFGLLNASMFSIGVDAIWLDGSEPEGWPHLDNWLYPHGRDGPRVSGNRLFNGYALGETSAVHDGLRAHYPDARPFTLTRASWAGQQRTGGVLWSGDIKSTWPTLRRQVVASLNFGLSGMPYWSEDIGGFFRPDGQYESDDFRQMLTRWFQFGAFTPVFRAHGTNGGTEYWLYGDELLANVNATNTLRHRLAPYVYSLARRVEAEGYTMQRHLAFDFAADAAAVATDDEFLFGPALLVAPVVDAADSARGARDVYLPATASGAPFVDFWTGAPRRAGCALADAPAPLAQIPLFGAPGTILALGPETQFLDERAADPLELRVYDGADARFTLYEDNGRDQAYATDGAHATIDFAWDAARRLFTAGARVGAFDGMLDARTFNVVVVRPGDGADAPARGVGIAPEPRPDATLAYTGEAYSVTL